MAKDKKSFLLYTDVMHTVTHLTDEQAGQLFKHLLAYVNDEDPVCKNPIINIAFEPIKQTLKRDLKKYEESKKGKSNAGKLGNLKRYNIDLYERVVCKDIPLNEALKIAKHRKASQSDTKLAVNDSVSVSVSVSDSVIESSYDDGVLKPVDDLFKIYLESSIPNAVIANPGNKIKSIDFLKSRLIKFTEHSKQQGKLSRTFSDYCSHFLNWNSKNKPVNRSGKRGILNN